MEPEALEPEQFWNGKFPSDATLVDGCQSPCQHSPVDPTINAALELQAIVSKHCDSEDAIDDALREYLSLTTQHKGDTLLSTSPSAPASTNDAMRLQMTFSPKMTSHAARISSSFPIYLPRMPIMCAGRSSTVSCRCRIPSRAHENLAQVKR